MSYVLAVDLGTGGPKVALVSATGLHRCARVRDGPSGVGCRRRGRAGPRGMVAMPSSAAARRALAESGVRPEQDRRRRVHGAVVGDGGRRRRRPRHRPLRHLDGLARRRCGAARGARQAERPGLLGRPRPRSGYGAAAASRPFRARTRWATSISCAKSVPKSTPQPLSSWSRWTTSPPPDRPGAGLPRLDHPALGHRQPRHQCGAPTTTP